MDATLEPLLTVKETAEYLRMHEETVRREIKRGTIRVIFVGPKRGSVRIKESEILQYLESSNFFSEKRDDWSRNPSSLR